LNVTISNTLTSSVIVEGVYTGDAGVIISTVDAVIWADDALSAGGGNHILGAIAGLALVGVCADQAVRIRAGETVAVE
jgi:hypothetical protein